MNNFYASTVINTLEMNLQQTKKDKLFFFLISIYSFIVCFGNFFRIGTHESAIGFSTIIVILAILISPFRAIKGVISSPILKSFLFLLSISLFSAYFYPNGMSSPLQGTAQLFGYLFLAGLSASMYIDGRSINKLFLGITLGLLISGLITIIDYLKIYDFPYVNENKTLSKYGGIETEQAGGFFNRRSAMAAYLSLFIPMITIASLDLYKGLMKLISITAVGASFISLFLTHNRSGIIGTLISLALYISFNKGYTFHKKLKIGLAMSGLIIAISTILYIYFPQHIAIYMEKLGLGDENHSTRHDEELSESDASRVYFFIEALKSILSSPIGHGFAIMYTSRYGYLDTHNIISYIIWATGIFGITWLAIFSYRLKQIFKLNISESTLHAYFNSIKYGVISWILNNMTHNNINMGIIWILIGLLIAINKAKHAE